MCEGPGDRKANKLGKRTQSARLIHQFISLENGSLLALRARQALASIGKFWLARPERVVRKGPRSPWNLAVEKMGPAFGATEGPSGHVRTISLVVHVYRQSVDTTGPR